VSWGAFSGLVVDDHRVQGVERVDRELLDARAFVGHLVAEGSVFAFLAEHGVGCFLMGSSLICLRRVGAVRRCRRRWRRRF
jgi:hypothetical protein